MAAVSAARPQIHGDGTPESAWQRSPWLAALPQRPIEALIAGAARLVVVSPHPDDEALGCGGAIACARRMGMPVHLVAVTDGEACYPHHPYWTPQRLRTVRRAELAAAAHCLGVDPAAIHHLGLADGEVGQGEAVLSERLQAHLQADDLVLTTWRHDGHPDHEASARAVRHAVAASAARTVEFPVWAWHWLQADAAVPQALRGAVRYALRDADWQAKQRALHCFASQLGTAHPPVPAPILPPQVLQRFARRFEVFVA
ncbi:MULTISPECIES: PIG-L deacetylase family protein [Xanthomonas]|uniref:PIG-L family deacetylase n=1 Tax=Xanthomonas rydalmerensis TaxID=3046274 RepID=A0ABZ0JKW8_9XANT|nr:MULTISPECIES: PIG-L family deacetylase [unclassified Xanthomonas]MBB5941204.1 LmbE family N-acetylglucosaminyl deacetylase [Xanthomonas sp. 3307]WOS39832.1 PIG-L family deacetylase [Xanthomonas sp. DM-2023]WOS44016.1 PIG-L family deacetylase [Xanthomonas sp. DM-2023]WOS48196.1 PIG-L family deacetylase [Xanthomonas sp. DM-2023]WOS52375.1 PIG-L family deacetylase [Xanthomonas sp. DM-2023]